MNCSNNKASRASTTPSQLMSPPSPIVGEMGVIGTTMIVGVGVLVGMAVGVAAGVFTLTEISCSAMVTPPAKYRTVQETFPDGVSCGTRIVMLNLT